MSQAGEAVVEARDLGKFHKLYARHSDRFKQFLTGRRYYQEFWALRHPHNLSRPADGAVVGAAV